MLTLSVVTLSVCLISVIFFVGVEEAVERESALYVLGKSSFRYLLISRLVFVLRQSPIICKIKELCAVPDVPTSRVGEKFKVPATNTFDAFYNFLNETFNFEFDSSSKIKFARD